MKFFMRFSLGFFFLFLFISQTPADELEDTALYGEDSIDLRAETSVVGGNLFSGGNLQVGTGGEITGDVYVEETLTLSDASLITGDVFVGIEAILNGSASITGVLTEGFVDFPEVSIPSYESYPGARNFTVRASQTRILREGSFNNVTVADGATLIFQGGTYQINRLILSATSTVVVNAPSILISALAFNWGAEDVQFTGTASAAYDFILYTPSASTSTIQRDSYFEGILYAPEGSLRVATGAYAKGVFKALSILVYPTAIVEWSSEEPPCVPEVEICDDGIDQDCDEVDQVCADLDADGDGFTTNTGDCDDTRSDVNPFASELCDGIDNNCDGLIDDASALDTSLWYPDTDGDGYGSADGSQSACSAPTGYVSSSTDCDDTEEQVYPGGAEVCDALDNDCDGEIDDDDEVPHCENGVTLPSNPEDIATEVDSTTAGSSTASTAFLYEGEGATQTGVAEGTIDISEAAVIRGQVFDSSSNSLAGVTVDILDHAEFGSTLTREDGSFDFVLNGGGVFTVHFEKEDYFSAQRQVYVPWQDYVWVDDVVLVVADSVVTSIDLTTMTEMEVAQGSSVSDDSGTRQATLLVPQGITAQMELPDGTIQSTSTLNIRATEYTSGTTGESAMPGDLPPTSAFTYAVEFSIDEATEVDATHVTLSEPLIFHLDNFLNFPVGEAVPLGYYDKEAGAWIPSENGLVIEILSITDGLADLDLDGSGVAADATALAELGVTDAEREKLGSLYRAGTSLWRVKIPHLTPWDCNWPFGSPDDAVAPTLASLPPGAPLDDPSCQGGSIIECENQTLGEIISLVGTSYALVYRSDRVPGRGAGYTVEIPLSGESIPSSLKRIEVEIYAAGLKETASVDATTNATYTYTWDGIDAYGRVLQGGQRLTVRVGYVYDAVYVSTSDEFGMGFANFGDTTEIIGDRTRREITFWQEQTRTIGGFNAASLKMGGWSLSPHHFYDPTSNTLYLGDGRRRQVDEIEKIITTIAGDGSCVYGDAVGDGEDATDSVLCKPTGIAADAEGNIYVSNDYNHRIRKIATDGTITTIAGTGVRGSSGDGGPATSAKLYEAKGLSVDTNGNLYFADYGNHKVRKVDASGTITTIAGTGTAGFSGDGGEAASAQLYHPVDTTLDDQGNLYILDAGNYRIRKVTLDGSITTIAGNGDNDDNGDNNPAINAELCYYVTTTGYAGIDVDYQGNIYYADGVCDKVRKITPDGIITTIVGGDSYATEVGDGGPATEANIDGTYDVVVDDVGNLYVADVDNNRIRKVTPDGIITTVAGNGERGFAGDDGLATDAEIYTPYAMALDPRGNLYVPSYSYHRIRKVYSPFEKYSGDHIIISSEDGTEIYEFDETGRHLNTLHPLTGQTLLSFTYNESGFLTSITDGDGNVVTLNRDGNNNLTSIVAPHGQETIVVLDANGYLNSVENPEGETYALTHDATGLLTEFTTPENNTTTFDYDDLGYLILDLDPLGGSKSLIRSGADDNFTVTLTTSLGLETIYSVEVGADKSKTRTITNPSGLVTETIIATNGTKAITYPNGVTQTVEEGPDPRFGMQAPILESYTVSTPASLVFTMETERSVSLTDPDDYLSLSFQTDTTTINGRSYTQSFDASNDRLTTTSPEGRQVVSDIDNQGKITNLDVAGLDAIGFSYDASGRLETIEEASDGSRTYNLDYDTNGFLDTITDPLSRQTTFDYDAAGRIITQTFPDARQVTYTYDANGNLETITPPGKPAHSFTYNAVELPETYLPPDIGLTNHNTIYNYNLDKQLDLITRPDGRTIDLEYDTGGRLVTVTTSGGTTFYDYNITTGQLETITTPTSETLTYAYDGFLPTTTTWSGTISGSVTKGYDDNFWINTLSLRGAEGDAAIQVSFSYDNDGLLTNAGDLSLTRDSNHGLITATSLSSVTTSVTYTDFAELDTDTVDYSGMTLYSLDLDRDNLGRITTKTETISGTLNTYAYTYDTAGRLDTVTTDGTLTSDYGYDDNGNRNSPTSAIYDDQDRLTTYGSNTYTYTDNGELLTKVNADGTTTYTYDALGNLITVVLSTGDTIEYIIDGDNRRIGKKYNGTLMQGFLYDSSGEMATILPSPSGRGAGVRVLAELNGDNTLESRFIYASKSNVPDYMVKDGSTYRIISDHLGSVILVVDVSSGTTMQQLTYDEWGNVTGDTSPGFQPFGFAGGLYDSDTHLVRFGARDYDAESGRWTAKDPILFNGGDTNLYGYVLNDPINFFDPDGLQSYKDGPARFMMSLGGGGSGSSMGAGLGKINTANFTQCTNITFGHGGRHIRGTGLSQLQVESGIISDVQRSLNSSSSIGNFWGRININGKIIEYRTYILPDGTINIGTYYPIN